MVIAFCVEIEVDTMLASRRCPILYGAVEVVEGTLLTAFSIVST